MSTDKETKSETCCLLESSERCKRLSGNASFNFRVQKLVEQRKLKFTVDQNVSFLLYLCLSSYVAYS